MYKLPHQKNNAFTIYLQKKAAGALFFAVAEFEMMSSRHEANHAGSIASVLAKIIEPFTNGYCYDAGRDINMAWLGKKTTFPYISGQWHSARKIINLANR